VRNVDEEQKTSLHGGVKGLRIVLTRRSEAYLQDLSGTSTMEKAKNNASAYE